MTATTTAAAAEVDRQEDRGTAGTAAADAKKKRRTPDDDPQTHTDFAGNLDACVAQGTRDDMDATASGQDAVERVWIMCRPPRLGRGVWPTVTARRAYVVLRHVQGRPADTDEPAAAAAAADGATVASDDPPDRPAAGRGRSVCDD